MSDTIPAVLRAAAATYPDRLAYVMGGERLTFAELHERVRNVARSLVDFGFEPGDRVAIWGPNSLEWVVASLATTYVGGIVVPLNSRYTAHEAAPLVHRSGARWVFLEDGFLGGNQWDDLQAAADLPHVETFFTMRDHATEARISLRALADMYVPGVLDADVDTLADAVSPEDVADVLFTSGTTGQPKGVVSSHWQTVGVARTWGDVGGVGFEDRYLVVNPFFHSFGYKVGIVTGLVTGATLYPLATFDPEEVMGLIQDERITVLPGAPTIFSSLLAAPTRSSYDVSSLRLAVTGAAVVPVVLIERMRDELAIDRVVTAFGMTEAVVATMCRGDETAEVVATTCGRAVPGMETRIDETTGELLLRGHYVMGYYLDNEEATAEAIDTDGWLHTGDAGYLEDGHLVVIDRAKDVLTAPDGTRFSSAFIENKLKFSPYVEEAVAFGTTDITAMITIDPATVGSWAEHERLGYTTYTDLAGNDRVAELLTQEVHRANAELPASIKVKHFLVLFKQLDPDDDEITRTRKVRRSVINERYAELIEALNRGDDQVSMTNTVSYQDGTSTKRAITLDIHHLEGYVPPQHSKQRPVWSGRR